MEHFSFVSNRFFSIYYPAVCNGNDRNAEISSQNIFFFFFSTVFFLFLFRSWRPFVCALFSADGMNDKIAIDTFGVQFTRSIRGNEIIKVGGHCFTLNRRRSRTSYWECFKKRCKKTRCNARIVTVDGAMKAMRGHHTHN